jgi:hypothetical protein
MMAEDGVMTTTNEFPGRTWHASMSHPFSIIREAAGLSRETMLANV